MMHPRTLRRLTRRIFAIARVNRAVGDFLRTDPDHTHALALCAYLSQQRGFIAAALIHTAMNEQGWRGADRMAAEVERVCREAHQYAVGNFERAVKEIRNAKIARRN